MKLIREIKDQSGGLVFRRWLLLRTPWFDVFVHGMYDPRGDRDAHCHDHPWSFLRVILWGGYTEWLQTPPNTRYVYRCPGNISVMPAAGKYHRVLRLLEETSYSLVFASRKRREWGYWTSEGWIDHNTYRLRKRAGTSPK